MSLLLDGLGAPVLLISLAFFAITAILWLLLPFSIFGIKAKLEEQLRVLRSLNNNLERLRLTLVEAMTQPSDRPENTGRIDPVAEESPPPADEQTRNEVQTTLSPARADPKVEDRWQRP